jgi:RNA polymerase sigma factor (sigma-70 family)
VLAPSRSTGEATFLKLLPVIDRLIGFVARRHRVAAADADEFKSYVHLKLIENGYRTIEKFEGRSSIETFLLTVIANLYKDFRNAEWGKWRPSAAARRGGDVAVLLERCLVRDGLSMDDACGVLKTKHGVSLTRTEIERIGARLPIRFRRRFESEDALVNVAASDSPDRVVIDEERTATWERVKSILARERAGFDAEDALIFAMRFDDGRKVAEIARALKLEQRRLYPRLGQMAERLKRALEVAGIDAAVIRELLDGD